MPYLDEKLKNRLNEDADIERLWDYLATYPMSDILGILNYFSFGAIRRWIKKNKKKYFILAGFVGTMICCVLELYRRVIVPYEKEKIKANGDVE